MDEENQKIQDFGLYRLLSMNRNSQRFYSVGVGVRGLAEYKIKKGLLYLLVVLAGILSAIAIYYYHNIYNLQSFMPGVRIAGVPVQGYNMEQAESAVGQRLTELGSVSVTFFKDDYSYQCKLSDLCMPLDAAKIVEDAWNNEKKRKWKAKISSMNGEHIVNYDVPVVYNKEVTDSLIKQWEEKWGVPYQDAKLEVSAARGLIVVPGHPGVKVDAKATFKALPDKLKEDKPWRIPIVTAEVKPEVQDQVLANMGELSRYSTSFRPAEINRSHNLYMAAAAINGKILNPGQVFSFNDQVGKRSQEKGYRDAMVIVNGRFEPGVGEAYARFHQPFIMPVCWPGWKSWRDTTTIFRLLMCPWAGMRL
jgi:hypothetical protein